MGLDVSEGVVQDDGEKSVGTADEFHAAVGKAVPGTIILLYRGCWEEWLCHPDGIVIALNHATFLNGAKLCQRSEGFHEPFRVQESWHDNVPDAMDAATCDSWKPHPYGIVFQTGNRFELLVLTGFDPDEIVC